MTVAVGNHLLERRAAVALAGNVAVDILMDDLVAVGFGVGFTVPALALNALLGLLAAVGVAIVRYQPQSAHLLQFLFARHKYHLSSSFKFVASSGKNKSFHTFNSQKVKFISEYHIWEPFI